MSTFLAPIIAGHACPYRGPIDRKELRELLRYPKKKAFSLGRAQLRILSEVVFPYWENYLKSIVHPVDTAYIDSLNLAWVDGFPSKDPTITRVAHVSASVWTSIDLLPESVLFHVELCNRNAPHRCLIIHEGRGRFEISFRNQECDGMPH